MRSQDKFKMSLSVQDGICIGNGLMMGIKAAYIIFASKDEHQAVAPLIDAVLELPPEQCEALTKIIKTKPDYISIFKLKPSDASSEEISSKLRNEISKALSEEH